MEKRITDMFLVLATVVLVVGCSDRTTEPVVEDKPAPAMPPRVEPPERVAPAPVRPSPSPVVQPARPAPPVSDKEPGIIVCALLEGEGGIRVGVIDKKTGYSRIIRAGDSFAGYTLKQADFDREEVTFTKGGRDTVLRMDNGSALSGVPTQPTSPQHTFGQQIDLTKIERKKFVATPDEMNAGIDPNDSQTWPKGYRGPAIERLIRANPSAVSTNNPVLEALGQPPPPLPEGASEIEKLLRGHTRREDYVEPVPAE